MESPSASEFTYRSARSGALVVGVSLAIAVEIVATDLLLRARHPFVAWFITITSILSVVWMAADYHAFGQRALRVDGHALDLRIGRRITARIPISLIAAASQPTWQEVPAPGEPGSEDYRNLMKPAPPNVLVTLAAPTAIRRFGVALKARRLGLRLDDPAGFIGAIDRGRSR